MNTYRIGRGADADIVIADDSVSRDHADLIEAEGGGYYWIDRNSSNGSFHLQGGSWIRLAEGYLTADDPIRLGSYQTTVAGLLAGPSPRPAPRRDAANHSPGRPAAGPVERDSFGIPRPKT